MVLGNGAVSHLNPSSEISAEGWGGDKAATWWMLSLYEGITASGDTMLPGRTVDQRLKATFMIPGFSYPEITTYSERCGYQTLCCSFYR